MRRCRFKASRAGLARILALGSVLLIRSFDGPGTKATMSPALPPPRDPLYQQNLARAQAVALASKDRPRRFIISDMIIGPATSAQPQVNPQTLDDAVQTLALLGINTPQLRNFGQLDPQIESVARSYGLSR